MSGKCQGRASPFMFDWVCSGFSWDTSLTQTHLSLVFLHQPVSTTVGTVNLEPNGQTQTTLCHLFLRSVHRLSLDFHLLTLMEATLEHPNVAIIVPRGRQSFVHQETKPAFK